MGMILRIASSRIVGQGDIVGRRWYFSLNLSANSVMRGRLDARRTLKSLVADLRNIKNLFIRISCFIFGKDTVFIPYNDRTILNGYRTKKLSPPSSDRTFNIYIYGHTARITCLEFCFLI